MTGDPAVPDLDVGTFDGRPCDPMRRLLLPGLAGMIGEGMIESLPINVLRVFGQMRADGGREISIGGIRHGFLREGRL